MTTQSPLWLDGVTKSYGPVPAARDLELSLEVGELVTLIGPSGCGKSTLLRLVAGLERPDAGRIGVAGEVVAGDRAWQPPERRRVGFVFQDHALFPHLRVADNVAFGLDPSRSSGRPRLPADGQRARVAEMLDLVRLGHLAARYPHELSGGEQQRVALARALAPEPAVMLLDEPFSSLDETLRAQVRADALDALRATGTAALLVTHDQTEALSTGDRVVVMHRGAIEQADTPRQVFASPATRFVASFVDDADFLPARVEAGVLRCELGVLSPTSGWEGLEVEVALRPHEVALEPDPTSAARVVGVEYHGAFALHRVRLGSGHVLRSWQPHSVLHPPGTAVTVSLAAGVDPVLVVGDEVVSTPPSAPVGPV